MEAGCFAKRSAIAHVLVDSENKKQTQEKSERPGISPRLNHGDSGHEWQHKNEHQLRQPVIHLGGQFVRINIKRNGRIAKKRFPKSAFLAAIAAFHPVQFLVPVRSQHQAIAFRRQHMSKSFANAADAPVMRASLFSMLGP